MDKGHEHRPAGKVDDRSESHNAGEEVSVLCQRDWERNEFGDALRSLDGLCRVYII